MSFNLDSLFVEWRSKVSTGVPNPKNAYHLVLLKEICLNKGIDIKIVDNVILALEQDDKKVDPETIVKFKDKDGEDKEMEYQNAIRQPEDTPARDAAEKLKKKGGKDDTPKKDPTSVAGQELQTDPEQGGSYLQSKPKTDTEKKKGDDSVNKTQSQEDKKIKPGVPNQKDKSLKDVNTSESEVYSNPDTGISDEEFSEKGIKSNFEN